jgi:hypothetical protein
MNKTTTIIPIHPPKYEDGVLLLESFHTFIKGDLWFIFSTEEDYLLFKHLTPLEFKHLILNNEYASYKNVINGKKLFGVEEMFNRGYDYVGVFDSEVQFVKTFNTDDVYPYIFNSNKFKANYTKEVPYIIKDCALAIVI